MWPLVIVGSGQLSLGSAKQKILAGNKQSTLALAQSPRTGESWEELWVQGAPGMPGAW